MDYYFSDDDFFIGGRFESLAEYQKDPPKVFNASSSISISLSMMNFGDHNDGEMKFGEVGGGRFVFPTGCRWLFSVNVFEVVIWRYFREHLVRVYPADDVVLFFMEVLYGTECV